jgi:hypothetical protein
MKPTLTPPTSATRCRRLPGVVLAQGGHWVAVGQVTNALGSRLRILRISRLRKLMIHHVRYLLQK